MLKTIIIKSLKMSDQEAWIGIHIGMENSHIGFESQHFSGMHNHAPLVDIVGFNGKKKIPSVICLNPENDKMYIGKQA